MDVKELVADREERNEQVISIKEETELVLNDTRGLLWYELCFVCERSDLCGCEDLIVYGTRMSSLVSVRQTCSFYYRPQQS